MTKLKQIRKANHFTITKVSQVLGISRLKYIEIEYKPMKATPTIALKLSQIFSVPVSYIFLPW